MVSLWGSTDPETVIQVPNSQFRKEMKFSERNILDYPLRIFCRLEPLLFSSSSFTADAALELICGPGRGEFESLGNLHRPELLCSESPANPELGHLTGRGLKVLAHFVF